METAKGLRKLKDPDKVGLGGLLRGSRVWGNRGIDWGVRSSLSLHQSHTELLDAICSPFAKQLKKNPRQTAARLIPETLTESYRFGANGGGVLGAAATCPALASSNSTLLFESVIPVATSNCTRAAE